MAGVVTEHCTGPKGGEIVIQTEWEWPIAGDLQKHNERVALLRPIPYEMTTPVDEQSDSMRSGKALSLNISSGGMLVLMDQAPDVEQVLKVLVPTPTSLAETPTLAEVRWTRRVPFGRANAQGTYFVGLKFIF
jgi:PilZ domain